MPGVPQSGQLQSAGVSSDQREDVKGKGDCPAKAWPVLHPNNGLVRLIRHGRSAKTRPSDAIASGEAKAKLEALVMFSKQFVKA